MQGDLDVQILREFVSVLRSEPHCNLTLVQGLVELELVVLLL